MVALQLRHCRQAQPDLDAKPGLRRALHRANELVDHAEWLIEENVDLHLQVSAACSLLMPLQEMCLARLAEQLVQARAEEFAALNPRDPVFSPQYMAQGRASSRLRGIAVRTPTIHMQIAD